MQDPSHWKKIGLIFGPLALLSLLLSRCLNTQHFDIELSCRNLQKIDIPGGTLQAFKCDDPPFQYTCRKKTITENKDNIVCTTNGEASMYIQKLH